MSKDKLATLAEAVGKDSDDMLADATYDSVADGICTNPGCTYTTTVEPDQAHGHCEVCGTQTVSSCLVLAGMI